MIYLRNILFRQSKQAWHRVSLQQKQVRERLTKTNVHILAMCRVDSCECCRQSRSCCCSRGCCTCRRIWWYRAWRARISNIQSTEIKKLREIWSRGIIPYNVNDRSCRRVRINVFNVGVFCWVSIIHEYLNRCTTYVSVELAGSISACIHVVNFNLFVLHIIKVLQVRSANW